MGNFLTQIIIILILGSATGVASFYFWEKQFTAQGNVLNIAGEIDMKDQKDKQIFLSEKEIKNKSENIKKETDVIKYLEKNIDKMTALHFNSNKNLILLKIWFIDETNFYVDFKDNDLKLKRVLINHFFNGNQSIYEVLGYFIPGDTGWVLKSGKDIGGAIPIKLYEKNEETGEWNLI